MSEDYAAITYLEEKIFPWHPQEKGEPLGRIRQTHAGGALAAAESLFRRSLRASPAGAGSRGSADPEAGQQIGRLLRWAGTVGRLIHPRVIEALDRGGTSVGGVEHDVFHEATTDRWIKLTLPGKSGKELRAQVEITGVRASLATDDAPPASYLRRLRLANEYLGDDLCLHGIITDAAGPRLVISQRHIQGEHAGTEAIAQHFRVFGFRQINAKTFYDAEENLLISDAHGGNVLRTAGGLLVPFDVCVQRPGGALRHAVMPSPTLDFGGETQVPLNL